LPRVYNRYEGFVPKRAVSVMRDGPYGNPFRLKEFGREECLALHQEYVLQAIRYSPLAYEAIAKLRGCDLVCCCKPKRCHADLLFVLANTDPF